jgi:hypothetical protein
MPHPTRIESHPDLAMSHQAGEEASPMRISAITPREAHLCAGVAAIGLAGFAALAWLLSATPLAPTLLAYPLAGVALGVLAGQAALATLTTLALLAWHLAHRHHRAASASNLPTRMAR